MGGITANAFGIDGGYDQLQGAGMLEVGGDFAVELLDGFVPGADADFQIFDAATLSGTFSAVLLPDLPGMLGWDSSDLYSSGTLSVIPEPATWPSACCWRGGGGEGVSAKITAHLVDQRHASRVACGACTAYVPRVPCGGGS